MQAGQSGILIATYAAATDLFLARTLSVINVERADIT